MVQATCPDRETLERLLLGDLPSPELDRLGEHLLECGACVLTAETLAAADDLTEALRARRTLHGDETIVARAIERGQQLRSERDTVESVATVAGEATEGPQVTAVQPPPRYEAIDFLAPPEQPDELGRLGGYRVLEVLGVGGMGVVFRAEDPRLKRLVALKAMRPAIAASQSAKDRFLREAQATAALEHDHIVQIYQVGEDRNLPFLAMQFLRGESLQKRLDREGRLDQAETLRIGREVAAGLAVAHGRGLIHRDIKPDNIWLEAATGRVKVLDFGLVRTAAEDTGLTQSGVVVGTPRYMAPEQARGIAVDPRCDLFSLGCVLYHAIAGKPPFAGPDLAATLYAVVHDDPAPLENLCPGLHPEFARLIARLLSKDRPRRPQSATEVVEAISTIEADLAADKTRTPPDIASPPAAASRATTPQPRTIVAMFLAGACALALAAFLGLWTAGVIFKVQTENGALVVKMDGDSFAAAVQGEKVTIKNIKTNETFAITLDRPETAPRGLKPGEYQFVLETGSGLKTRTDRFAISAGQQTEVEVWWEPQPPQVVHDANALPQVAPDDNPPEAALPVAPAMPPLASIDLNGEWDSRWGMVAFAHPTMAGQLHIPVRATYYGGQGVIEGNLDVATRTFEGRFREANGRNGVIRLAVAPDGNALAGRYGYDANGDTLETAPYAWDMTRRNPWPPLAVAPFDAEQAQAHQAAWAERLRLPVEYVNGIGMRFRLIPPGEFLMGATPEETAEALELDGDVEFWRACTRSAQPEHQVVLTQPIYLSATEVTLAEFESIMGSNPWEPYASGEGKERLKGLDLWRLPAAKVSWNEAAEFCTRLSQREGLPWVYARDDATVTITPAPGYRLPTEAEWEFACRAGTTTKYWTGDDEETLREAAWFADGDASPRPVGWLKPNPFGLYDVHGNVYEWVQDWWTPDYYAQFQDQPAIDPTGPALSAGMRGVRGGDFFYAGTDCRSADRFANEPVERPAFAVGFRVALPVDAVRQALADGSHPQPAPAAQLFNGDDLAGWRQAPPDAGGWQVQDGLLIGSGGTLTSERSDGANFRLRVEFAFAQPGIAALYFRAGPTLPEAQGPTGYAVELHRPGGLIRSQLPEGVRLPTVGEAPALPPGQWCALDVIADGPHLTVKVDGKTTVDALDDHYAQGAIVLQAFAGAVVQFRKIEIAPLNQAVDLNGAWDSRWGIVRFEHEAAAGRSIVPLRGSYYNGAGTIEGDLRVATRTFVGRFRETSGPTGPLRLIVSPGGDAIAGRYMYGEGDALIDALLLEWDMTRRAPE